MCRRLGAAAGGGRRPQQPAGADGRYAGIFHDREGFSVCADCKVFAIMLYVALVFLLMPLEREGRPGMRYLSADGEIARSPGP